MIPPACHRSPKAIPDQTNSLSDPRRSYCPVLSASVPGIFSLAPPPLSPSAISLSSRMITFASILPHTFRPRGFTCKFVYMPVCVWPAAADVADQDCLTTLRDIKLVGILSR